MYLIRCALNDRTPARSKLDKMDFEQLYETARTHSLPALCAYALEKAGVFIDCFEEAKARAIRKNIILDIERGNVFERFDKAGIWYMPLKGIIIKEYYPKIGMREMADNDILVDRSRQEDIKQIMLDCGFYVRQYDKTKHDVYFKDPLCNLQMHISLFEADPEDPLYSYFKDIDRRLIPCGDSCERCFTKEDFYLYIKAHEYKHYSTEGTGLRNLVDTYLLLREFGDSYDWDYLYAELDKMQIREYEKQSRELANDLFSGKRLTDEEKRMLDYYIFSDTYGNTENGINNLLKKNSNNKTKYVLSRLFPTETVLKKRYPFVYKHRILLPFLPLYRVINLLVKNRKKLINEARILMRS